MDQEITVEEYRMHMTRIRRLVSVFVILVLFIILFLVYLYKNELWGLSSYFGSSQIFRKGSVAIIIKEGDGNYIAGDSIKYERAGIVKIGTLGTIVGGEGKTYYSVGKDSVTKENIYGRSVLSFPFVGYIVQSASSLNGVIIIFSTILFIIFLEFRGGLSRKSLVQK